MPDTVLLFTLLGVIVGLLIDCAWLLNCILKELRSQGARPNWRRTLPS